MKRMSKGFIRTPNEKPDLTADEYSHLANADQLVEAIGDKEIMAEFEKHLTRKTNAIIKKARGDRVKPREISKIEKLLLLSQIYKRRIALRIGADKFREKYGECLYQPQDCKAEKSDVVDCCEYFTTDYTPKYSAYGFD